MSLKSIVDNKLKEDKRTFKWLVEELDMSVEGLKSGLRNESIKLKDLKKLCEVLNIPITMLVEGNIYQRIKGNHNTTVGAGQLNEDKSEYKREVEQLRDMVSLLKAQLKDKEEIIELLKNK